MVKDTPDYMGNVVLTGRNASPSHYVFKIESFSLLSKSSVREYITSEFDAGGFKWYLSIYFTGDESKSVDNMYGVYMTDYISIYLHLASTTSLPIGWEVNAIVNFFIFNQHQDKYFGLQDGRVKRFHAMKTRWGIPKFIDLTTFSNSQNGYLIDDECVFGAEVFVIKNTFEGERLSMMKEPPIYNHTWKVTRFSTLKDELYESESFGCYNWIVSLYPYGYAEGKGNCISLFVELSEHSNFPSHTKLFTKWILRVKDQMSGKDTEYEADRLFTSSSFSWGCAQMLSLAKLKDPKQGYLVDDTCIIEAQVTLLGMVLTAS